MRLVSMLAIALLTSACGRLEVEVDVLNPNYLEEQIRQPELRQQLAIVIAQTDEMVSDALSRQRRLHDQYLLGIANTYRQLISDTDPRAVAALRATADRLEDDTSRNNELDTIYVTALQRITAANRRIRNTFDSLSPEVRSQIQSAQIPIEVPLSGLIMDRASIIRSIQTQISNQIGASEASLLDSILSGPWGPNRTAEERSQLSAATDSISTKIDDSARSLTGGQTVAEDPLAYAVANADERHWATRYNNTLASGYLGDFDVAIKLESLADFTVKGVAFDPSTVAQVASKVTTQSLLIAAQIAGVPVTTSADEGTGAELSQASATLAAAEMDLRSREALVDDYNRALFDLGASITREREIIAGESNTARQRAAAAITLALEQFRSRLDMSGM